MERIFSELDSIKYHLNHYVHGKKTALIVLNLLLDSLFQRILHILYILHIESKQLCNLKMYFHVVINNT